MQPAPALPPSPPGSGARSTKTTAPAAVGRERAATPTRAETPETAAPRTGTGPRAAPGAPPHRQCPPPGEAGGRLAVHLVEIGLARHQSVLDHEVGELGDRWLVQVVRPVRQPHRLKRDVGD